MDPSKNPVDPNKKRAPSPPLQHYGHEDDDSLMDDSYLSEMIDGVLVGTPMSLDKQESEERFDLAMLNNQDGALDTRHFDERDYQSHRRESFPHSHHPLRPSHSSRSSRRKSKQVEIPKSPASASASDTDAQGAESSHSQVSPAPSSLIQEQSQENIDRDESQEREPLLDFELESLGLGLPGVGSPFVSQTFHDLTESPPKRVQFEIGSPSIDVDENIPEKKKHRRHHHHHKYGDPVRRHRLGSEVLDSPLVPESLDLGPEVHMADLDKDDLTAHRFADNKSFRRHRFASKISEEPMVSTISSKPTKYDHQPHEIFVELDVLSGHGEHREWKEAARWIKYEEDVEEGADRWGRPHVASLSFHSLINLRRLIESGVTLLDLEERDLPGVAYRAVEAMVVQELIQPEDRAMIMRALLLKHRHVNESDGWRFNLRRNTHSGSLTSLHAMLEDKNKNKASLASPTANSDGLPSKMSRRNSAVSRLITDSNGHDVHQNSLGIIIEPNSNTPLNGSAYPHPHTAVDMSKLSLSNLSEDDVKWVLNKESLLRRIPVGAEASIVLVGKDDKLKRPIMAFIRLAEGSYMPNITELPIPVRFLYILLGPSSFDLDYKEVGRSISTLMSNRHFHEIAYKANDRKDLLKGIHEFLDESIVLPPGDWDNELFPFAEMKEKSQMLRKRKEKRRMSSIAKGQLGLGQSLDIPDGGDDEPPGGGGTDPADSLKRTKKLFGGMMNDVRRRYPIFWSDIRDGLNMQIVASIIFIYFACISGAIAFGGILGEKTGKHIGISETLIATSVAGIVFSLLAGQPLLIIGTTGPLLLFDDSLYQICVSQDIDFLGFRFWIGMWVVVIGMVVVCFEGSFIARYFTRFVQEIFASMIALLFVYDAINNIIKVYMAHPLQTTYGACNNNTTSNQAPIYGDNDRSYPNTALLSTILCLGTFSIAYGFRMFRISGYFTPTIRKFGGNFAVPIAVMAMVGVTYALKHNTYTENLQVPDGLDNTKPRNSWIVSPSNIPMHYALMAFIPACLVFILMFMETCICSLIIGKKENKLLKGGGYHLDIFLICLINGGIATIGGCWVCAATVRAVAHASSLTIFSTNNPPGEKPSVLGVKEQRVSNLFISILVGLSVLMSPVLKLIPMPVLFGVFLYMGISSMDGIQFFERCSLLFKQVANHPQVLYVRRVKTSKMHLFTLIQIMCLVILFGVKLSPAALAIPFLLILLIPLRMFVLKKIFKRAELAALDAKGLELEEDKKGSPEPPFPFLQLKGTNDNRGNESEDSATLASLNGRNKDFRSIW